MTPAQNTQTAHMAMELHLRRELMRHRLSLHELLVALALLRVTWNWGLKEVTIPKLEMFGHLAGLTAKNHVHLAIKGLVRKHIVAVKVLPKGCSYSFNEDVESWKIDVRIERSAINATLAAIGEVNKLHVADPLSRLAKMLFTESAETVPLRVAGIEDLAGFAAELRRADADVNDANVVTTPEEVYPQS